MFNNVNFIPQGITNLEYFKQVYAGLGGGSRGDLKKRSALHLGGMAWIPKRNDAKNSCRKNKMYCKKIAIYFYTRTYKCKGALIL